MSGTFYAEDWIHDIRIARCQWLVAQGIEDGHVDYEDKGKIHVTRQREGMSHKREKVDAGIHIL